MKKIKRLIGEGFIHSEVPHNPDLSIIPNHVHLRGQEDGKVPMTALMCAPSIEVPHRLLGVGVYRLRIFLDLQLLSCQPVVFRWRLRPFLSCLS